jgi:hypothetical protein
MTTTIARTLPDAYFELVKQFPLTRILGYSQWQQETDH